MKSHKLKPTLIVLLLAMPFTTFSQSVKEMQPELGYEVDKSPEGELAFLNKKKKCAALYERDRKKWQSPKFTLTGLMCIDLLIGN